MSTEAPPEQRTLPHNPEAERTVLGAILVDNQAFNSAAEILSREDFYREAHRRIFEAMAALAERSQPIDLVTLKDELGRQSALEAVGGAAYLAGLVDGVPRITSVDHWSRIIKEKAVVRNLIHAGNRIVTSCYEGEDEAAVLLHRAEKAIFDIAERRIRAGFVGMREIVKESFRTIDQLSQSKDVVTGLATGFVDIDEMTSGLQKGDLVIVAGRPAMGKTSFCLNIAQHVSMRVGETVGLFSLEMSKEQLALRLLCADARIDAHKLRTGKLSEKDWARLAKAYSDLSNAKLFIDDSATISPLEMRAKCRRLKAEFGLGLVIVDYLQLVTGAGRVENRQQELSAISRSMKGLAKELSCPVVALSQLSRAPEARTDRRPQLSDLRECVTGDTLVVLADGRRIPIADLVGQTPEVLAVSAEQRIVRATSDKVWRVGRRPVFDVSLAGGGRIRATGLHRLLGDMGWARVSRLKPGDSLATAPRPAGDVSWDRVASVQPAGEEDVYDLTVPGPASWLADGVVSHNSGALEQDADIVMFIYREEEYKPTDENKGIAEIIIGKQRNGPTGSRKLAFIKEFTRFENLEWHAPERSPV